MKATESATADRLMFLSRRLASVPLVSKVPQVTTSTSRMLLQDRMAAVIAIAFACASPKSRRVTSLEQTQGQVRVWTHHVGDGAFCVLKARRVAEDKTRTRIRVGSQVLGLGVGFIAHVAALELVGHMDALEAVGDGHLN